jgi:hypothetical protein
MDRNKVSLWIVIIALVGFLPLGCLGQGGSSRFLLERSSLSGDWKMSRETVSSDCNGGAGGGSFTVHYQIEQAGDSLVVTRFPVCNFLGIPEEPVTGPGSVIGEVVTFSISQTFTFGTGCTRQTIEVASGVFDGVKIKGEVTTAFSDSGDCGPGLPCPLVERFTMARCSGGGCSSDAVCAL